MGTTSKINSVNSQKAVAQAKANATISLSSKDLLKSFKEKTQGQLKTTLGTKTEIYKKSLFEGMNEREIKSQRKKIRGFVYNMLSTIKDTKSEKLILNFIDFYKQAYLLNDFSFSSIASENTKEEKKAILQAGLKICKEYAEKNK